LNNPPFLVKRRIWLEKDREKWQLRILCLLKTGLSNFPRVSRILSQDDKRPATENYNSYRCESLNPISAREGLLIAAAVFGAIGATLILLSRTKVLAERTSGGA